MAQLSFDGIQPVRFGGKDCTPKIDAELRLRIRGIKIDTEANLNDACEKLALAFPDDRAYVEKFLKEQMTPNEIARLQTYLFGGASAVRTLDEMTNKAIEDAMKGQK